MANPGNQIITFTNGSKFDPDWLNRILYELFPDGVYTGLDPTIVSNGDEVEFSAGEAIIFDDSNEHAPHIGVRDPYAVTADPNAPYFVLGWEYDSSADKEEDNTAYFGTRSQGNIASHEIKLGKASFDGNNDVTSVSTAVPTDRDEIQLVNAEAVKYLFFSDDDSDSGQWKLDENSNGNFVFEHPELNTPFIFDQSGSLLFPDTDGDGNQWELSENADGSAVLNHSELNESFIFNQNGGLVFPDADGDGDQWKFEPDGGDGHLHISHPEFGGDIILRQDGRIETDGRTGNPGSDDRLVPRGYVDDITKGIVDANYFSSQIQVLQVTSGGDSQHTVDFHAESGINDNAQLVWLNINLQADDYTSEWRKPGESWKSLLDGFISTSADEDGYDNNILSWFPLPSDGQLEFRLNADGSSTLNEFVIDVQGEIV